MSMPEIKTNLFTTFLKPPFAPVPASASKPLNYHLVGISWDAEEYVAMVEAEGEHTVRFIRKGNTLPGGIEVKDVKEYAVFLAHGKEQWELT